jgi:hypothetical protein
LRSSGCLLGRPEGAATSLILVINNIRKPPNSFYQNRTILLSFSLFFYCVKRYSSVHKRLFIEG